MNITERLKLLSLQHQLGFDTINTTDSQSNLGIKCQLLAINHYIHQAKHVAINAVDSQCINAVDAIEEIQQDQSIDVNPNNDISKDDAIQAAIEHLESDQTQSDIPESEKPEDAALVETLKAALSQKERYPKIGGITIAGLPLAIENPEHSTREGIDPDGTPWQTIMRDHYGYIEEVIGHDGDELDMFLKPGTPSDWAGNIYVIEQTSPQGEYDEDKVMIGYDNEDEAKDAYMSNYSDDWDGFSDIETYTIEEFMDCCDHLNDDISDENNN